MNVELLDYTKNALEMLIYTKSTRLQDEWSFMDVIRMPMTEKMEIYDSMLDTIQSPFEFVDFTFKISGVSRSFTHQLVRTRNASYAQESHRAVAAKPDFVSASDSVRLTQENAYSDYKELIDFGMPYQDAREVLPTGIKTSILMKVNLRELGEMAEKRLCVRTAGEYQQVFKLMKEKVTAVYPFLENYIEVYCVKYGTCCFPRYDACPVRREVITISRERKEKIKQLWSETNHVADPSIR